MECVEISQDILKYLLYAMLYKIMSFKATVTQWI